VQCSAMHLLQDLEGALKELCEKYAPATVGYFVEMVLNIVMEKNEKARVMSGGLFVAMVGTQIHKYHYQNSKYDLRFSRSPNSCWSRTSSWPPSVRSSPPSSTS
jgi:hypothetical protein